MSNAKDFFTQINMLVEPTEDNHVVRKVDIASQLMPNIQRVDIQQSGQDYTAVGAIITLDRPAPANCYIQFHRYSKRSGGAKDRHGRVRPRKAFRPIDIVGSSMRGDNFWVLPVPEGASRIETAPIRQLYRPPWLRHGFNNRPTNAFWNIGSQQHANKCQYKFSTCILAEDFESGRPISSGNISSETLEIMMWAGPTEAGRGDGRMPPPWGHRLRMIAKVY